MNENTNNKIKKRRIMECIANHYLLIGIVGSVVFALIIHCLFSKIPSNEWFTAKWEAGDILTYVSTISLGLLAVWQNKKYKEDNDASQTRMENMANEANELSFRNKVIEHESNRIMRLRAKAQVFIDACDTQSTIDELSNVALQPADFMKTYVKIKMDNRDQQIRLASLELLSELKTYSPNDLVTALTDAILQYCNSSRAFAKCIRECSDSETAFNNKTEAEKLFLQLLSDVIIKREELLSETLYGNLSLEDIKVLYH